VTRSSPLALALAIILGGCGGSETTSTVTATVGATGATGATGVASNDGDTSKPEPPGPEETVQRYYDLVDEGSYNEAWPLLPPGVQADSGGFQQWRAGYATSVSTTAHGLRLLSEGNGGAVVSLRVSAIDRDACGERVDQEFAGRWTLERNQAGQWAATAAELEKTGGGTPTLQATDCAPAPESAPVQTKETTGCTPGYSPCLPPDSDYDCDNGSGDGPSYTGQVSVTGPDPYDLDADGDGIACDF
jgi:hypothetical protein